VLIDNIIVTSMLLHKPKHGTFLSTHHRNQSQIITSAYFYMQHLQLCLMKLTHN